MTPPPSQFRKIAIFSNYVPIECGISTFAKNLFDAIKRHNPAGETFVIAVDDGHPINNFPEEVVFEVAKQSRSDYRLAADYINSLNVDAVCIQHEYGIFGGNDGILILDAMCRIEKPIVVTLHTVLENPTVSQKSIMTSMAQLAAKLVVMSERAVEMLQRVYAVVPEKISMIHHGVPDAFGITSMLREQAKNGATLMTFGLLSPDKGIENVIRAMPRIVAERPDAKYLVVGATHPHIRRDHGEAYRESLICLAEELHVSKNVEFVNRFVSPCEIIEFLEMADIYVTPYLKKEQITSGTLAYAIGSGKVVISTPYWYAEELLREDRGLIVPAMDSEAIADAAIDVLTNDQRRKTFQDRATDFGRSMSWRSVGGEYVSAVDSVSTLKLLAPQLQKLKIAEKVPVLNPTHLCQMTDNTGLLQHAIDSLPRFS